MTRALVTTLIVMALVPALSVGRSAAATPDLPANVEFVGKLAIFSKYRLKSNGMPIYLAQNRVAPVVTFAVVYHVGSRNEAPGHTGSTHLLEHMLFGKSTVNFGKANGHKTIPEVFRSVGANDNMITTRDEMRGFATLPSRSLELAMKVEADRLGRALILDEERQPEMSVVRNEYEIGENEPSQALMKAVVGTALLAHPYRWDPIGYRSDIEGVSTDKLRELYKTHFWPNNAEAILVGDFDTAEALAMFDREFGSFAASSKPIPEVITVEPPQEGERRVVVKRPGQVGIVQAAYVRPGVRDPDFLPVHVLAVILARGVNSRLRQALVETQIASSVSPSNESLRDPFVLLIEAVVAPGSTHQKTEDVLKAALYDIAANGVTEQEVRRAQKQIEVIEIRSRDGTQNLASSLGDAIASASWEWWESYIDTVNAVTVADVNRVAAKYLVPDHATIGWFVPVNAVEREAAATGSAPVATPVSASSAATDPAPKAPAPVAATADVRPFAQRTLHRVLANGVILDVVENHTVPTIALHATVQAGTVTAPPGKPALADLTAEMLGRGTVTRNKRVIAEALESAGAELDFNAGSFDVTAKGAGLSRDATLLLEMLAEQLKHPVFAAEEIEKAKAELKTVILQNNESTDQRAYDRIRSGIFPAGHPYRAPTQEELLASLAALTRDDIARFHRDRYNGSSLILTISGDVDAAAIAAVVENMFGDIPRGERPPFSRSRTLPGPPVREVVTMPGKANVSLIYGAASGLARKDPDYEAAVIANAALGQDAVSSRIGQRVRVTEGLSYDLRSRFFLSDFLDGYWAVNVAVAPANLKRALQSTREEVEKFCREGATEQEVADWKQFFAGAYQVGLGSNAGIAAALADAERFGYGPAYLDQYPERVRRVTRAEVNAAIKAHLHPDKLHLVIAGDVDRIPE